MIPTPDASIAVISSGTDVPASAVTTIQTAAHRKQKAMTAKLRRRSSVYPSSTAPMQPPTWNSAVTRMAVSALMPLSFMIVGNQLFRKYRSSRLVK